MTLRIHAPNPIRVGETANVLVTSDNPGVVSLTYGAGLTGPATATIEGTRVWRNGLKYGQYLAREGASTAARVNCAWFLEINTADLPFCNGATNNDYNIIRIVQNFQSGAVRLTNYHLMVKSYKSAAATQGYMWGFGLSVSPGSPETLLSAYPNQLASPAVIRVVYVYDGVRIREYSGSGTSETGSIATTITGTMGGNEVLSISFPCRFGKMDSVPSQAQREAFCQNGTFPSGLVASYQGGHEIVESAPVFWDTSGNNLDLTATDVPYWPPAAASGDYTDTSTVTPYAIVPVTAIATTGTTIDATRPRQGVPERASYSERTEVADQCVVTVNDPVGAVGPVINARIKIL